MIKGLSKRHILPLQYNKTATGKALLKIVEMMVCIAVKRP